MEKLKTIKKIKVETPSTLHLWWNNGTHVTLDMREVLRHKAFVSLKNTKVFAAAKVGEWGHSVEWPDDVELGADTLWRMTLIEAGKQDAVDFMDWRMRNGLSLSAAADALGISRRMVAYYSSGDKPVPRTVLLACRGWEASAA